MNSTEEAKLVAETEQLAVTAPRVSICGQVLNQSEWLKEMIASVVAQSFKDWEFILVDDGSTEDIKAVVDSFADPRIRLIRFDENKGIPIGTNVALRQARGEFFAFLSADEVISAEKLQEQIEYFDAHPGVDAVWGIPGRGHFGKRPEWEQNTVVVHDLPSRAYNRSNEAWMKTLLNLEGVPIGGASMLMRRKVVDEIGYLDENLTVFSDHEFYCRFFGSGHVGVILPYRWAMDKQLDGQTAPQSVRGRNAGRVEEELAYVRAKHSIPLPPTTGKVTVGIPCYNMAKFLPDAVASVLKQTYQDIEILILDDGSTDDFKTVIQGFDDPRIRVLGFQQNMGIQDALNQMAFRAKGEFFVVLSADDTIDPTFIERCLAEFKRDPWLEFVASQTDFMDAQMKPIALLPDPLPATLSVTERHAQMLMRIQRPENKSREEWMEQLHGGNQYFGVGMYRTKVVSDVGGWDKSLGVISDYEMYLKLLVRGNIHVIEENLTHTRVHGENYSQLNRKRQDELPILYAKARKPYYRPLMRVIIATPFYELKGFSPYIESLIGTVRLLTALGIDWRFMQLSGDSYVHRARNTMCDMFLRDPDSTDLFFIDSDMSWNPEAFVNMCLQPEEVIGAAYPVKNQWQNWTSIPMPFIENGERVMKGRPLRDGSALIEAFVLAGGFLRIKRSALEKYREAYPDMWYLEPSTDKEHPDHKFTEFFAAEKSADNKFFGEDHMFSKRLRDMGLKMFIYPAADISHWGYKDFSGNYDQYLKGKAKQDAATEQYKRDNPEPATGSETVH